ncbi:ImmA/IrrE family metallo-endopeptidase [soil metagenome]
MSRVREVPITSEVLRWAIDESGWERPDLAEKLKVSSDTLQSWETGSDHPSQTQFNALVQYLKRPSAVFFLPSPPPSDDLPSAFRSVAGENISSGPEERRHLREARRVQAELSAIIQDLNYPEVELFPASTNDDPQEIARAERARFGISIETQLGWRSESEAFDEWRSALGNIGVLVFLQQIGHGNMRGYALRDEYAPITGINTTGFNVTSRIYSMFHEYAHLLLGADDVTHQLASPKKWDSQLDIERWCERFAASFLLPREDLESHLRSEYGWHSGHTLGVDEVRSKLNRLANRFKVSLRAMALRLQDIGIAPKTLFESLGPTPPRGGGGGKGMPRAERARRKYGLQAMVLIREALQRDVIGVHDVLDLLGITFDDWAQLDSEMGKG